MHFIPFEAYVLLELLSQCVIYTSVSPARGACFLMHLYKWLCSRESSVFVFFFLNSHAHLPVDDLINAITLISHRHLETWEFY